MRYGLALLVAMLAPATTWAGAVTGAWSPPVDGVSARLVATNGTFLEGGDTGRDAEARLELAVDLKNTTAKEKKLKVIHYAVFELGWEITAADGTRWTPTFFPPSPPPPGDRSVKLVLKAGEERRWLHLHGISGFNRADEPPQDRRWFQVLPAGRYRVQLKGVPLPGHKQALQPGPIEIVVRPVDRRVGGLLLQLAVERPTTTLHASTGRVDPVHLTLVAVNVGGKPLRLAPRDLLRRFCDWDVQGSYSGTASGERKPRPAGADEYVALRPGARATLTADQLFPGALGSRQITVSGRGWYQLRASCDRPAEEPCPVPDCWSGRISSNIVWLRVR